MRSEVRGSVRQREREREPSVRRLLGDVSESPTQAEAQAGLRAVREDPTLELLSWVAADEAYVAVDGSQPDLTARQNGRAVTSLPPSDQTAGARGHDPRLLP